MSVAFILNQGYNTINNVHHTFWDQDGDAIKNSSLTQALEVTTSVAAPSHVITGGTNPAQLFMSDPITLETDAPQFKAPILQAPSAELEEVTELTPAAGITFLNDVHFTSGTGPSAVVSDIDGVGTLTCGTLKYTTLDPAIPTADVSQWATFGASTNVNLNGHSLTDATRSTIFIAQPISAISSTSNSNSQFGNSINDSSLTGTIDLWTNEGRAGSNKCQLNVRAANSTGGSAFYANPRSITLNDGGYGGDIQLSTSGTGKYRLIYDNSNKAITVNQSGALCFNSTFGANTPVEGSFGTAGQIIQSNGSAAPPSWVNAPSASNWSTYDATSDVDLAGYKLTNSSVADEKIVYATSSTADPYAALMVTKTASSTTADNITFIGCEVLNPVSGNNSFQIVTKNTGAIKTSDKFGDLPASATFVSFNASANVLSNDAGNSTIITYDIGRKGIEFNGYGCVAFDSVCNSGATPPTQGSFGTAGQVLQSNGSIVAPSWVDAPSASNWSTYDATSDVDLASYSLTDSLGDVKISKPIVLTNTDNKKTKLISLVSPIDNNTVQTAISLSSNTGYATQSVVQVISNPITITAASIGQRSGGCILANDGDTSLVPSGSGSVRLAYSSGSKATTINSSGALAFNSGYTGGVFTEGNFGTTGYVAASAGSSSPPTWTDVNTLITTPDNILYVSKNGSDSNKGSIAAQKLTIQSAINTATLSYPQQVVIIIAAGVYSENLSITRPNITLLGYAPSSAQNLLTQIVGSVSIACTASQDLYYSQVCIYNLQISGLITDTSSVVHTLNIEQCRMTNTGQIFAQTSSANNRTRLFRCVILQSSTTADVNPMLLFSSGDIYLNQLDVTAKNNCNVVKFNGTAKCPTCATCLFNSDTTSTVAEPIVLIAPTDGTNYPFVFTQSAFVYSSYAPKLSHPESAGICVSSAAGRPYISVTYNSFALAGTNGSNYAIYDTGYNTATAGYYFYFSNNGGVNPAGIHALVPSLADFGAQASAIYGFSGGGSQNKFTLSAVA